MCDVIYVGCYDSPGSSRRSRNYSPAAADKMDYISWIIRDLGHKVVIVSAAYISDSENAAEKAETIEIGDGITLKLPPSNGANDKIHRILRVLKSRVWMLCYLIKNTRKNSLVISYHDYELVFPVLVARFFRRFNLLMEVEEQYSRIWQLTWTQKYKERLFLRYASDKSIVVSEVLARKLRINHPIIVYGNYIVYEGQIDRHSHERIRLLYTGTIDSIKNGAYKALDVMPLLPSNYELVLSGKISKDEEKVFLSRIDETNKKCNRNACKYAGNLSEYEYQELLLSADIGLNLQREGEYSDYFFPSKIIKYLSYNLPVVSTKATSIKASRVADYIYFLDGYDENSIAEVIESVDLSVEIDRREIIRQMSVEVRELIGKELDLNDIKI